MASIIAPAMLYSEAAALSAKRAPTRGAAAASNSAASAAAAAGSSATSRAHPSVSAAASAPSTSAAGRPAASAGAAPSKPAFPALTALGSHGGKSEQRTIRVPPHRYTPLKESWDAIVKPIVEQLKLQIRMNTRARAVEIKSSAYTADAGVLQKAEDYVRAFMLGFDLLDAIALLVNILSGIAVGC